MPAGPPPAVDMEQQIKSLAAASGVDEAVVRQLVDAQNQQAGEPIGTLRADPLSGAMNPMDGAIAHRVLDGGIPKWRVSHPINGVHYEMTPTKENWDLIRR